MSESEPIQNDTGRPLRFDIGGMHCAACSARIERVLGRMPGIKKASVNLATSKAQVWTDANPGVDIAREIMSKVANLGFTATPSRDEDSGRQYEEGRKQAEAERKRRISRLWPMAFFTILLLLISMGHMMGIPLPAWLEPHASPRAFCLAQLLLALPVVWLGRHFYLEGIPALCRKAPNMDSLVAIGTGAAFLYSLFNTIMALLGSDPVYRAMNLYYESCAVLLAMIELGQFLEFTARTRAGDAIGALLSLTPETALRIDATDAKPVEIPVSEVRVGDRLLVRPGSRIPVDGVVLEGCGAVDLSLLTGESIPVPVGPQDQLVAGSVNGEGSIVMRATAIGQDTKLSRIIKLVRDAQGSKAPIARLADRVSFYFVPAVIVFACIAGAAWLFFSDEPPAAALTVFVAVLVMACPCAMGLATPMSIMVGTGRGAQMGILIKSGGALEEAGRITALCLDKTGTITEGRPSLTSVIMPHGAGGESGLDKNDILILASSLEARSEHPLALAIIRAAEKENSGGCPVDDVRISPGLGIAGSLAYKNSKWQVAIGNEKFMDELELKADAEIQEKLRNLAESGQTPLLLSVGKDGRCPEIAAILSLADELRPESPEVVAKLKKMGIRLIMLTGDNEYAARAIAGKAGIEDVRAGLLPAEKAAFVRQLREEGQIVGMVGDGLNDAPALALANVGMAVGSGVDISAEAGDIVLMAGGMNGVLSALSLSRATMRNIRENLGWAFGYNILGLPIAAGVLHIFGGPMLSPMLAGTAMALSSFSVVTNALRLRWFGLKKPHGESDIVYKPSADKLR